MKPIRIELPTQFAVGTVNCYLFTAPEPILVDCGESSPQSWAALRAGLAQHGLTAANIRQIIITHPHVDHSGQAAQIVAESGAAVYVADLGYDWLIKAKELFGLRASYYQEQFLPQAGFPTNIAESVVAYFHRVGESITPVPTEQIQTFQIGDWLEMGGASWQVLHMPGHASHQTCFYQPESRQFLSGDMLLPKTPAPIVERPLPNQPRQPGLPIFLDSLARCEQLEIDTVYPGHGDPFQNHLQLIQQQRRRIQQRKAEALALIQQGHRTAYALMNEMYAHYPPAMRFAGLWMLIGYLDLLLAEEAIVVETVDGVWNYYVIE